MIDIGQLQTPTLGDVASAKKRLASGENWK
jgi:hypothetical protein